MPKIEQLVKVTWQELKDLRDNSELVPGNLYRITDYQCTTTQENTQSAGHQFDIVLLALSENKLAEEGWVMMNESNVYDVTFSDGITKKCYLYRPSEDVSYDIIDVETLLGYSDFDLDWFIANTDSVDVENRIIVLVAEDELYSTDLNIPNLTYNYFQNSNLSAWKVWYCLDNDTDRFNWADNEPGEYKIQVNTPNYGNISMKRNTFGDITEDNVNYYSWINIDELPHHAGVYVLTTEEIPSVGDKLYQSQGGSTIVDVSDTYSITEVVEPVALGRGVIYRLIDEFNNDCPYDFKNIQYFYSDIDDYAYTFHLRHEDDDCYYDGSLNTNLTQNDEAGIYLCENNKITSVSIYEYSVQSYGGKKSLVLNNIICYCVLKEGVSTWNIFGNEFIGCFQLKFSCLHNSILCSAYNHDYTSLEILNNIILVDKKVVTEDIS